MGRDDHGQSADEDLRLAHAVLKGDPESRREFIQRMECVPRLLGGRDRRHGRVLSREGLEDCVQEVLLALWRRLPEYDGRVTLEAWAHGFCRTEYLRARSRLGRDRLQPTPEPVEVRDSPDESTLVLEQTLEELQVALRRLDSRTAKIVLTRHTQRLSFDELGRLTGVAGKTARNLYYMGIRRLRELLETQVESDTKGEAS